MLSHLEESDRSFHGPAALQAISNELHAEPHADPMGEEHNGGDDAVQTNSRISTSTARETCNEKCETVDLASKDEEKQAVECHVEEPSTDSVSQKSAAEEVRSAIRKHQTLQYLIK